jgi:hypothetical protein
VLSLDEKEEPVALADRWARRTSSGSSTSAFGAGHDGGRIVFRGHIAELVAAGSTLTGERPAAYVGT